MAEPILRQTRLQSGARASHTKPVHMVGCCATRGRERGRAEPKASGRRDARPHACLTQKAPLGSPRADVCMGTARGAAANLERGDVTSGEKGREGLGS